MWWMAHRKWEEAKQLPGTAGLGNRLGCCLIYFHFLWAIHPIRPVHSLLIKLLYDTVDKIVHDCLYGLLINMITVLCLNFLCQQKTYFATKRPNIIPNKPTYYLIKVRSYHSPTTSFIR